MTTHTPHGRSVADRLYDATARARLLRQFIQVISDTRGDLHLNWRTAEAIALQLEDIERAIGPLEEVHAQLPASVYGLAVPDEPAEE